MSQEEKEMLAYKEVKKAFIDKLSKDQEKAFMEEFHAAARGAARHAVVKKYGIHLSPDERKGVEEFFAVGNKVMDLLCDKITEGTKEDFLKEFVAAAPGDARHKVVNKFGIHLNPAERKLAEDFFAKADLGLITD